jgi:hypothetical protein
MTEDEICDFRIVYEWFGLTLHHIQPYLTTDEWRALNDITNKIIDRVMAIPGYKRLNDDDWPDTDAERWNACK